jgi:His-Xaa-Ser repeat-associated upstream radical SAM protein
MMVVTARCNCFCDYCHASSLDPEKENYDMIWETAKSTIDMIFRCPSPAIKIEFQGGEPLLNWDVVKQSVRYAKQLNKTAKRNLDFVICTNLILADDGVIDFCKQEGVMISSSLDGPKELHDNHRKSRDGSSSYDKFIANLSVVRRELGPEGCSALLTITRDNLHRLPEIIDHYIQLGFSGVFLRALNPYGYAVKNFSDLGYSTEEFVNAFRGALKYIIELNLSGTRFTEYYTSLLLQRILTPFSTGFVDLQSPSGAGISGVIYDYNGEVYPADEARMLARMGDKKFLMGNVHTDSYSDIFDGKVIQDIIYKSCVEVMPECATCCYQLYCGADPIRNYVETGDIVGSRPDSGFCRKHKGIFDIIFEFLDEGDEKIVNLFWSWATRRSMEEISLESN